MVDGVPPEVFYVASARAHAMAEAAGAVAGAVTIPHAIERLRRLGLSVREVPLAVARLTAEDVGWPDRALAEALAASAWKEWPAAALLELDSPSRLAAALRAQDEDFARDRERLQRARGPVACDGPDRRRSVLVTVPAMYQSGANAAWEEIVDRVACRTTSRSSAAATPPSGACWMREASRHGRPLTAWCRAAHGTRRCSSRRSTRCVPTSIHFDGAEGSTWAPVAFARGTRIVQHVRLNELERFQPAFAFADAIVAVAPHLQRRIAARLGPSARVEHIADGIDLQARLPVAHGRAGRRPRALPVRRAGRARERDRPGARHRESARGARAMRPAGRRLVWHTTRRTATRSPPTSWPPHRH